MTYLRKHPDVESSHHPSKLTFFHHPLRVLAFPPSLPRVSDNLTLLTRCNNLNQPRSGQCQPFRTCYIGQRLPITTRAPMVGRGRRVADFTLRASLIGRRRPRITSPIYVLSATVENPDAVSLSYSSNGRSRTRLMPD